MPRPTEESKHSKPKQYGTVAARAMQRFAMRIIAVAGLAGLVMLVSMSVAPPARSGVQASVERRPLGSLAAVAWSVHTPVGERLQLRPVVNLNMQKRELRTLAARKPRVSARFVARFVTKPRRGRIRTLAVVSRRVRGLVVGASSARTALGRRLRFRSLVLTRRQTTRVKRAAKRGQLAIVGEAQYRVRYVDARGRTVVTPRRSRSVTLPVGLKRQRAWGGNLRKLAVPMRKTMRQMERTKLACVTRNTILRQLRNSYSTMVSGDRSGAAALLRLYIRDAASLRTAGLLSGKQAIMLQHGLGTVLNRVGWGHSKRVERVRRWGSLRNCVPAGAKGALSARARAHSAQTIVTIIARRVVKRVRKTVRHAAEWLAYDADLAKFKTHNPGTPCTGVFNCASYSRFSPPGLALRGLLESEWPTDTSEPTVAELVPPGYTEAGYALEDKLGRIKSFLSWEECCLTSNPGEVGAQWSALRDSFVRDRWRFQPSNSSQQLDLLPAFTEYINMYLAVLREGVVNGPAWGLSPDTTLSIEDQFGAERNPNDSASAMSYSNRVYDAGFAKQGSSSDPETDFALKNDYKRDMQIAVLDFREMWHLQDPVAYPFGEPDFKQDRMIYSDAIGTTSHAFAPPPNPFSPLKELAAWTTRVTYSYHYNQNWLTAIEADGARTGATTTGTQSPTYSIAPGTTLGPVVQVGTTWDQKNAITDKQQLIGTVRFYFSNNEHADPGGNFYAGPSYNNYPADCCTSYWTFDGEVLAAAKVMGSYNMGDGQYVADSLVLGFRQADSFYSQWKGSLPGRLNGPSIQTCLGVAQVTISSGTHIGANTGSRTNGSPLEMRDCDQGAWDQNWQYIDYNDPNTADDDAAQHSLTVYAGTMCATPKDGATSAGTPVEAYYCDEASPQKWTRNADGSITNDQSKLCLERAGGAVANGTPIRLNACDGNDAQRWTWPD